VSNLQLDAPTQGIEQTVPLCGATRRVEGQKNGVMEQRTRTVELYQGDLQSWMSVKPTHRNKS
jgi:hypothetical protein